MVGSLRTAPLTALTNAVTAPQRGLIVADGLCPQIAELLPGALHELVALGVSANPLAAITQELQRKRLAGQPVDTLHIVAHGRPGAFQIGGQWVDSAALIAHADQLAQWQVGSIALWSCEVNRDGIFSTVFQELTGSDIITWGQRISSKELAHSECFSIEYLKAWQYELGTVSFSPTQVFECTDLFPDVILDTLIQGATVSQADPTQSEGPNGDGLFSITTANDFIVQLNIGGTIYNGTIQRRYTGGGNDAQFLIFYEDVNGNGSVAQGGEGGKVFAIVKEGFTFSAGSTPLTTNSAPNALDDLNDLLVAATPFSVSNVTVNEGSPYAVFTLTGGPGQLATLSLANGTTTGLSGLQIFDPSSNTWVNYTSGNVPLSASGSLLVRTTLSPEQDFAIDNGETFTLTATNTGGSSATGTATVRDDGTGSYWIDNAITPASPEQLAAAGVVLDNDKGADNDGVPGLTEEVLATRLTGDNDQNNDGVNDSEQPAIATLAWIDNINFDNAVTGNFDAVPKRSIITVASVTQGTALNTGTALEAIKVIPFSDVPEGAPKKVFSEWTPIQFAVVPATPGESLTDVDSTRAGIQTRVLIDNSAAELPSNYFDRYYTYVSADIINRYQAAGIALRTLDGELLTQASQAGWHDYTQRTPGGDGGRYITKNGKIMGVEITFTDNSFGDDDPTVNRIEDPSTLVLAPTLKFDLKTDSQVIGDRITANGLPIVTLLGAPNQGDTLTLNGSNGDQLVRDQHYRVREISIDGLRSAYAIELLDAQLSQDGIQHFGHFFSGIQTGNDANTTDGKYTVFLNGNLAGDFEIRTNALSTRNRAQCLNGLSRNGRFASVLYGYRTPNNLGTNGDDVMLGDGGSNRLNGKKGSDLINGFGDRLTGDAFDRSSDLNQVDVLIGGKGRDYFQLGDIVTSFYVGDGNNGYARVIDFKKEDTLILTGSASDYTLRTTTLPGQAGVGVYQGDDLVALIQGKASRSLNLANPDQVFFL